MGKKTSDTTERKCSSCGCEIGERELAVNHDGALYCPQCFVHVVAPASGGRFTGLVAAKCQRCSAVFVATGTTCPQCKYRVLQALPRK